MAIRKSELYSALWTSCDALRGGMDASQYKDYVLVLLFVKYVSDKFAGQPDALIEVPDGGSFRDMVAAKGDKDIGDRINKIIHRLAEANNLLGVIDVADFNDSDKLGRGTEMVDRLTKLVGIFQGEALDFSRNRADGDDLLGDAYEYLMRNFATQSGKSKGQFYTPAEVSRVMARVIGTDRATSAAQTLYDPTCGSGSLLLKAADEAPNGISIYGQEMDNATAGLARMNMILHGHPSAEIWRDNTLSSPRFKTPDGRLKTFDFAVANPPFSNKAWRIGLDPLHDPYGRFDEGIPPDKNGDYAFLLHLLHSLRSTGKGAIILPHGVLFRGNAEAGIRRRIVRQGVIRGIIGLPANLFYGTGIPACIIVLDKEGAAQRSGIFMIDASKGFQKDGAKNRLRHQDIHCIVDTFTRQLDVPRYSRFVPLAEIEANDYNLNIPRYVDSSAPEDLQDIEGHLRGGIPQRDVDALSDTWAVFPSLPAILFEPVRPGYLRLKADLAQVKPTIFGHPEFTAWADAAHARFSGWAAASAPRLRAIAPGDHPKALIAELSERLLHTFTGAPLIDRYDVYQRLMTYWTDVMQDDVYLLAADGWKATPELIPRPLLIARYLAAQQAALDDLQAQREEVGRQLEALQEEHGGEEGLLAEATNDKDRVTKATVRARLKLIRRDPDAADERAVLDAMLALFDEDARLGPRIREAEQALDAAVTARYKALSVEEVQALVVDDKWLTALAQDVQGELDRVSQALTGRVRQLAERYAAPLPELTAEVDALRARVDAHLARMGFSWN